MRDAILAIRGMHCDGCAERVRAVLDREPGVRAVEVSFADGLARVRFNEHAVRVERLVEAIEDGGFEITSRS